MSQIHIDGMSFSPSLSWPFLFLLFFFSLLSILRSLFLSPPPLISFLLFFLVSFFLFASSLLFFFSREPRISLPPAATPRRGLLPSLFFSLSFFPLLATFNYTTATISPRLYIMLPASEKETFLLCHAGKNRAWWRTLPLPPPPSPPLPPPPTPSPPPPSPSLLKFA